MIQYFLLHFEYILSKFMNILETCLKVFKSMHEKNIPKVMSIKCVIFFKVGDLIRLRLTSNHIFVTLFL